MPIGPLSRAQFVADYLHPNDRAEFDTALEKAIRTRGRFHVICRINAPPWGPALARDGSQV